MSVTAGWENFFVAEVGAAAALSGLLFVAVSMNLARILGIRHLPGRAAETLVVILLVLFVATFGLIPGQSREMFGYEIMATALLVWFITVRTQVRAYAFDPEARPWIRLRVVTTQAASLPFVVAGVLLALGRDRGVYWIVPGTLAAFSAGVLNAWVLLVEILR